MNGLSAGLGYVLNNAGGTKRVLILEKNPVPGGYVTTFARHGFHFDTSQMASNISDILDYFKIQQDFHDFSSNCIKLFKVNPDTDAVSEWVVNSGETEFEESIYRLFPNHKAKLRKMLDYSYAMFREIYSLKSKPGFFDILNMLATCPKVIRNRNKTFTHYLRMFDINDPDISLLFQAFSGMCGLPNNRVAALLTVGVMFSLREQAYRPSGRFIELPLKLAARFQGLGGELIFKKQVSSIIVENGSVRGVRCGDGSEYISPVVISTIDPTVTMHELVGDAVINRLEPPYLKRINNLEMTTSAFTVHLGIDDYAFLESNRLPCGYGLLTMGNDSFDRLFAGFREGKSSLTERCFYIGYSCPPDRHGEKPVLSLMAIPFSAALWTDLRQSDPEGYTKEKENLADIIMDIFERYLAPGLREHVVYRDIATPATFARYSGSPTGSLYDMASVPINFGANRLPLQTPVKGLLLPKFAHGLFGAMNSGLQAADALLGGRVMRGNSRFKKGD